MRQQHPRREQIRRGNAHQLQLVGQQPQPLGRLAERHTAQARQLDLELLDLECGQPDRVFAASSCSRVV